MPERLYPGVHVEESVTDAGPIPGVPASTDERAARLADAVARVVAAHIPEWTHDRDADPGVTLIELAAFLTEMALYRPNAVPYRSKAAQLAVALGALARRCVGAEPLQRPNFFSGRLLDAAAMSAEQDYHRQKRRLHNRALFGSGIVCGLSVHVDRVGDGNDTRIVVEPGFAIDGVGEEVALICGVALAPPTNCDDAYVTLRFQEWPHSALPVDGDSWQMSMVEEGAIVGFDSKVPSAAIALARLSRNGGEWCVDGSFLPPRIA